MDLLASLNIHELPEQQTRINGAIDAALKKNPDLRLGFDACLSCATPLKLSNKSDTCCKGCSRVWYCSKDCKKLDSDPVVDTDEEQGLGHSSVICALLRLCSIDDYIEDSSSSETKMSITKQEQEASQSRITSEYESYPATLANVLTDAPCFQPILERYARSKRRGKTVRQEDIDTYHSSSSSHTTTDSALTIHIIGASHESELWAGFKMKHDSCPNVYNAYADSLTELISSYKMIKTINLIFVGPDCPQNDVNQVRIIQREMMEDRSLVNSNSHKRKRSDSKEDDSSSCRVVIHSVRTNYDETIRKTYSSPDIIVFFNPGFTCPDYSWQEALDACVAIDSSKKLPFLVTTNTEMEAISDLGWLHQYGYIESLPETVSDIINDGMKEHDPDIVDYNDKHQMFFGENPNQGSRVRQSGNMANDLFVKNRWIYGGLLGKAKDESSEEKSTGKSKKGNLSDKTKRVNSALM